MAWSWKCLPRKSSKQTSYAWYPSPPLVRTWMRTSLQRHAQPSRILRLSSPSTSMGLRFGRRMKTRVAALLPIGCFLSMRRARWKAKASNMKGMWFQASQMWHPSVLAKRSSSKNKKIQRMAPEQRRQGSASKLKAAFEVCVSRLASAVSAMNLPKGIAQKLFLWWVFDNL